jgi:hypothetical protein
MEGRGWMSGMIVALSARAPPVNQAPCLPTRLTGPGSVGTAHTAPLALLSGEPGHIAEATLGALLHKAVRKWGREVPMVATLRLGGDALPDDPGAPVVGPGDNQMGAGGGEGWAAPGDLGLAGGIHAAEEGRWEATCPEDLGRGHCDGSRGWQQGQGRGRRRSWDRRDGAVGRGEGTTEAMLAPWGTVDGSVHEDGLEHDGDPSQVSGCAAAPSEARGREPDAHAHLADSDGGGGDVDAYCHPVAHAYAWSATEGTGEEVGRSCPRTASVDSDATTRCSGDGEPLVSGPHAEPLRAPASAAVYCVAVSMGSGSGTPVRVTLRAAYTNYPASASKRTARCSPTASLHT